MNEEKREVYMRDGIVFEVLIEDFDIKEINLIESKEQLEEDHLADLSDEVYCQVRANLEVEFEENYETYMTDYGVDYRPIRRKYRDNEF